MSGRVLGRAGIFRPSLSSFCTGFATSRYTNYRFGWSRWICVVLAVPTVPPSPSLDRRLDFYRLFSVLESDLGTPSLSFARVSLRFDRSVVLFNHTAGSASFVRFQRYHHQVIGHPIVLLFIRIDNRIDKLSQINTDYTNILLFHRFLFISCGPKKKTAHLLFCFAAAMLVWKDPPSRLLARTAAGTAAQQQ